jgi:hypothetical protein
MNRCGSRASGDVDARNGIELLKQEPPMVPIIHLLSTLCALQRLEGGGQQCTRRRTGPSRIGPSNPIASIRLEGGDTRSRKVVEARSKII